MYVCMLLKSEKNLKNPENLNLVSYKIITPGFVYVFCSPKNNCRDMALCLTKTWNKNAILTIYSFELIFCVRLSPIKSIRFCYQR